MIRIIDFVSLEKDLTDCLLKVKEAEECLDKMLYKFRKYRLDDNE